MKVKTIYILSLLLVMSIGLNIYYISNTPRSNQDKDKMNRNIKIGDGNSINISKDNFEDSKENTAENELENSVLIDSNTNPIDTFFDTHEFADTSTLSLRLYAVFYKECWKDEMEYAYNTLLESGHIDIKDSIMKSYEHYLNYADNESDVVAAVKASNAFGDENRDYSESISYGTISLFESSWTLAELYKERALVLRSYLDELGIHIDYVFDEKNISDEEQKLFNK